MANRSKLPVAVQLLYSPLMWLIVGTVSIILGLGVLLLYPFVKLFAKNRALLHQLAVLWARIIARIVPGMGWDFEGLQYLPTPGKPAILVANHQSQSDIVAIMMTGVHFHWLAKSSLFHIPIFGWAMAAIGYIPVNRDDKMKAVASFLRCKDALNQGISMMFFPEGTRSPTGLMQKFKSGAFKLATETGVPVIPITIVNAESCLPKGSLKLKQTHFRIVVHPPIECLGKSHRELARQARSAISAALPPEKQDISEKENAAREIFA